MNIACSVRGCIEPVIGQCTGYKRPCGRFYCHVHSLGTLCDACAAEKARDEEIERIRMAFTAKAVKAGGLSKGYKPHKGKT